MYRHCDLRGLMRKHDMSDIRATNTQSNKKAASPKGGAAKRTSVPASVRKETPSVGAKKASAPRAQVDTKSTVTAEERQRMIAEAAYLRAEKRGFVGGDPADDWLSAETEIDRILSRT